MVWFLAIVVVFVLVIGAAAYLLADRRSTARREDVDIDSLLANLGRLQALESTGLMDAPRRADFDELTREAAGRLHAPMAFMSLVDDHRQFFASEYGRPEGLPRETGLEYSYCKHVVAGETPFKVTDSEIDLRVKDNLSTTDGGVRSYFGVPLRTSDGQVIGSFCVADNSAREWDEGSRAELELLAAKAMTLASRHPEA
ncbi:MAG: hypothetical protein NVSMB16_10670 [Acidimicrobiales bacterium]